MQELSLNILDIAQNSAVAEAKNINIYVTYEKELLYIGVDDDGIGMDEKQLSSVTDPFFTSRKTRHVGLGVPFFKMAAEMTGGEFSIKSRKRPLVQQNLESAELLHPNGGTITLNSQPSPPSYDLGAVAKDGEEPYGTSVKASFFHRHIDCAPMGDLTQTITMLLTDYEEAGTNIAFFFKTEKGEFETSSRELRIALAGPLNFPDNVMIVRDYVKQYIEDLII